MAIYRFLGAATALAMITAPAMAQQVMGEPGYCAFFYPNANWLIGGGTLLIAAIVIGTAITVLDFRERAINNRERELENTVLLLARHFDRELHDFEAAQRGPRPPHRGPDLASPAQFKRQLSGEVFHTHLRGVVQASSDVAGINVFDADGQSINSSQAWPVAALNIADRAYFKAFAADDHSQVVQLAPINSALSGGWTTVIARKVVGPNGVFLGVVARDIAPANLERFFAALALGEGPRFRCASRRDDARAFSPRRSDDRAKSQYPADPANPVQGRLRHDASDQPRRRRRPAGVGARPERISAFGHRHDDGRNRARRLAGADATPGGRGRAGGDRDRAYPVSDRPKAFEAAQEFRATAGAGKRASRHRRQQHDAGPAAVRCGRADRAVQPALSRNVRTVCRMW